MCGGRWLATGDPAALRLHLPWPPALNRYYRNVRGRTLISREGRAYRRQVALHCLAEDRGAWPLSGRLAVRIQAAPPDRRRRDVDGMLKAVLDALTHAGLWRDDSQVDDLRIVRCRPVPGGALVLDVTALTDCDADHETGHCLARAGNRE